MSSILAGVESAINALLPLDQEVADELSMLDGRILKINLTDMNIAAHVRIAKKKIILSEHYDGEIDATISGSSTAFLKNYVKGFSVGSGVVVEGDMELVENFNHIMNKYHIDWEELLSNVVGDIAAHKIHGAVADLFAWGKDASQRLMMDVSEYVHEEGRLAPSKEELEDFFADIANVRDGVERAQARLNNLKGEG